MRFEARIIVESEGQTFGTYPFRVDLDRPASDSAPFTDDETRTLFDAFEEQGEIGQIGDVQAAARENPRSLRFMLRLDRSLE